VKERLEEAAARERVRDAYRAYATDDGKRRAWDARNPGNVILRAEVLERILAETADQRAAGADVLDVGCGGGWWLAQLAGAGVPAQRLHGVDLIAERVERARSSVPGALVELADATALPFEDARFGVVLLLTTLSSAGGPARRRALLMDARRVLAPGGVLIVYEPRWPNPRNRHTHRVARRELRTHASDEVSHEAITLLPPVARRLGERGRPLARVRALRSHRLTVIRAPR
jgi:SAM-dependent methyltransferase